MILTTKQNRSECLWLKCSSIFVFKQQTTKTNWHNVQPKTSSSLLFIHCKIVENHPVESTQPNPKHTHGHDMKYENEKCISATQKNGNASETFTTSWLRCQF